MDELTKQQKAFVHEYLTCLDATKSALKAGYTKPRAKIQGELLLKKDYILRELNAQLTRQANSLQVGKAYVIRRLLNIIEFSLEQEEILEKDGTRSGKTKLKDPQSCLRALDCLCKHLGLASSDQLASDSDPKVTFIDNLNEKKI